MRDIEGSHKRSVPNLRQLFPDLEEALRNIVWLQNLWEGGINTEQASMMHKIYGLLLFIGTPFVAFSQYARLLKNPDIVWAAEMDVTYSLTPPPVVDPLRENEIAFWKCYDPKESVQHDGGEMLIRKMLEAARSGAWPAWQVDDLTKQLDLAAVSDSLSWPHDTIITFDVVTFEVVIKNVRNDWNPSYYTAIRTRQLLFYDDKKGEFGLLTTAVAPVLTLTIKIQPKRPGEAERDTVIYERIPFWLKMSDFRAKTLRKSPDVNDTNISWAAQIRTLGNSPEPGILTPLKQSKEPVMQVLLNRFRYDRRYTATNFYNDPLPFESREALFVSTDTVMRLDPETYVETIEVNRNELSAEHTLQLRLVQNWYWDDRKQRLIIQLERFAPIAGGDLWRWSGRPLFYRRAKR